MSQVEGIAGRFVDRMIRRTVRLRFRAVHWITPESPLTEPCILVPNHHGWHDGEVMYLAAAALNLQIVGWVQDYEAKFGKVGGMPFPLNDPTARATTIRKTIKLMKTERRNLLLFAEGTLHEPPTVLPFGKALDFVAAKVEGAKVIPVAIKYEMAMHDRPECFLMFGKPMEVTKEVSRHTRLAVKALLDELTAKAKLQRDQFGILAEGTLDANERRDMRRTPGLKRK